MVCWMHLRYEHIKMSKAEKGIILKGGSTVLGNWSIFERLKSGNVFFQVVTSFFRSSLKKTFSEVYSKRCKISQEEGCQLIIRPSCPENCMKMKKNRLWMESPNFIFCDKFQFRFRLELSSFVMSFLHKMSRQIKLWTRDCQVVVLNYESQPDTWRGYFNRPHT